MKLFFRNSIAILAVFVVLVALGTTMPITALAAATSPALGDAASFSVLAGLSMSAAGAGTTISGNLGLSPGLAVSRTGPWTVGGTEYFGPSSLAATAQTAALGAFNNLIGQTSNGAWNNNTSPAPGVWTVAQDATFTGTLTLTGNYNDVWVFQIGRDMTFSGSIVMAGNAQPCHVFWQIGRSATIASGTSFIGTLIASEDITLVSGATVNGRVISLNSSLTTDGNTISEPTCAVAPASAHLIVIKHVINNNGGTKNASDFTLTIGGVTAVGGNTVTGAESPGIDKTLSTTGAYTIAEAGLTGYSQSSSANCSGTIAAGETKICTITNDDIAPSLTVTKTVVNLDGGTKVISDFSLFIDGNSVTSGVASTTSAGLRTVSETPDSGYASTIGGDCATNGTITLAPGDIKICTITNDDIAPVITPAPSSAGGGRNNIPPVPPAPPLIEVIKVPDPLALPAGPGPVTYTYTLHNLGTVPITNITMVGDTCSPINLVSGDINADAKLDVNETWIYRCSTTLSETHTNTITANGWANGISTTDIASATVIVGIPIVPPLIHVTKVPSPLALLAGGGIVTFTEKITNPGTVALSNVRLTDDKCSPVTYISGDTNNDSRLDIAETWTYACQANLTKTTTNTATASGEANGLAIKDFAIATVVVAAPGFPKAGFAPKEKNIIEKNTPWNFAVKGIFLLSSIALAIIFKKRATQSNRYTRPAKN